MLEITNDRRAWIAKQTCGHIQYLAKVKVNIQCKPGAKGELETRPPLALIAPTQRGEFGSFRERESEIERDPCLPQQN